MLLNIRAMATSISVLSFFCFAFLGWFSGLSQLTCCKRAIVGAIIVYISASIALKIVNAILSSAVIDSQIKKQRGTANGNSN